jgi:hypothetical protein
MRRWLSAILAVCTISAGCGTTKWSDTARTATEQLLISDSMDRAVSKLDFRAVAGKRVYLDSSPLSGVTDSTYLVSLLRQHMLAQGCLLKEDREQADYVVEVRAGAVGTDRREVVFGVPATNVPEVVPVHGVPSSIPEMTLAKKTEQRAVTKIAVFAYNRHTGRPVWQSGVVPVESKAKDVWLLGAGPFQRGTIYEGTEFAGEKIAIPLIAPGEENSGRLGQVSVADEAYFAEPQEQLADAQSKPPQDSTASAAGPHVADPQHPAAASEGVIQAGHAAPEMAPVPQPPPQPIQGPQSPLETPPHGSVLLDLPRPPLQSIQPSRVPPNRDPTADVPPDGKPASGAAE